MCRRKRSRPSSRRRETKNVKRLSSGCVGLRRADRRRRRAEIDDEAGTGGRRRGKTLPPEALSLLRSWPGWPAACAVTRCVRWQPRYPLRTILQGPEALRPCLATGMPIMERDGVWHGDAVGQEYAMERQFTTVANRRTASQFCQIAHVKCSARGQLLRQRPRPAAPCSSAVISAAGRGTREEEALRDSRSRARAGIPAAPCVSTPSATTCLPSACAIVIMVSASVAAVTLCATLVDEGAVDLDRPAPDARAGSRARNSRCRSRRATGARPARRAGAAMASASSSANTDSVTSNLELRRARCRRGRARGAPACGKSGWRSWCTDTLSARRGGAMPCARHMRQLRAAGLEHPGADVDDQAALLRGRHEFARIAHALRAAAASAAAPRDRPGGRRSARIAAGSTARTRAAAARRYRPLSAASAAHALHRAVVEHRARRGRSPWRGTWPGRRCASARRARCRRPGTA